MRNLLTERRLLAYLAGNLLSIIGTWAQRVVVFWTAWELTGSSSVIGLLAALDLIPSVFAAPVVGWLADRRPPFRMARNLQLVSALPPLVMVPLVLGGEVGVPALMVLSFATGMLNGFDHPLRLLLVGKIVAPDRVAFAVAANSVVFNIGRMIGPALGGWIVALQAPAAVFGYNAVSYALFAAVFALLGADLKRRTAQSGTKDTDGPMPFRKLVSGPVGLMYLYFAAIALLIRPVFELLPAFAADLVGNGRDPAEVFTLLTASQGLGAMCGGVLVGMVATRVRQESLSVGSGLLAVLTTVLFLSGSSLVPALACLAALSGAILMNGISTQIAIQTRLPSAMRGRALSLYTVTFRGLPALGALIFGALGDILPQRGLFAVAAALVLLLSVAIAWPLLRVKRIG